MHWITIIWAIKITKELLIKSLQYFYNAISATCCANAVADGVEGVELSSELWKWAEPHKYEL